MVEPNKLGKEATDDILAFSKKFYLKYGVYPTVIYTLNKHKTKTVSLPEMENIINNLLKNHYNSDYTVRTRSRLRDIVIYRQIMFKMLYDMGYTLTVLSKFFNYNHATVLYSKDTVNDFLEINDARFSKIYNNILDEIKQKNGIVDPIQPDDPGESNT